MVQQIGNGYKRAGNTSQQVRKRQNTQKNVKCCPLKGISPNRHQDQCISHHCYWREYNDDNMTCHKNTVRLFCTCSSAQGAKDGDIYWNGTSRVVHHVDAARFTSVLLCEKCLLRLRLA